MRNNYKYIRYFRLFTKFIYVKKLIVDWPLIVTFDILDNVIKKKIECVEECKDLNHLKTWVYLHHKIMTFVKTWSYHLYCTQIFLVILSSTWTPSHRVLKTMMMTLNVMCVNWPNINLPHFIWMLNRVMLYFHICIMMCGNLHLLLIFWE